MSITRFAFGGLFVRPLQGQVFASIRLTLNAAKSSRDKAGSEAPARRTIYYYPEGEPGMRKANTATGRLRNVFVFISIRSIHWLYWLYQGPHLIGKSFGRRSQAYLSSGGVVPF
jgi:hypothetical protein